MALVVILNSDVKTPEFNYDYGASEDYSSFLFNTKIQDLSNDYVTYLTEHGYINNTRNTIMEQIDEFYYNERLSGGVYTYAGNFTMNVTESMISKKYGYSYRIQDGGNNVVLYARRMDTLPAARVVMVSRKITFLQVDSMTFFGPSIAELKIWI